MASQLGTAELAHAEPPARTTAAKVLTKAERRHARGRAGQGVLTAIGSKT